MYIGCHLSAAKGYVHMGKDALSIGANTFQFFTRNPRGARAIHAQRLFIGSASAGACPRHDRRRPGTDGASARQSL